MTVRFATSDSEAGRASPIPHAWPINGLEPFSRASRLMGRGLRTISRSLPGMGAGGACAPAPRAPRPAVTAAAPVAMRKPGKSISDCAKMTGMTPE